MLLAFFLLWVIFNGNFTLEICIFGVVITAAMFVFVCKFMDYSPKKEIFIYKRVFLFIGYVGLLVKEIVKANIVMIRIILNQREEIVPTLATFHTNLKTATGKAFLANAITLTPGTITVSLEDDLFTIHCLDESLAAGENDNVFAKYLKELEQ